jgi:ATP-binding cassette subfamily B protein
MVGEMMASYSLLANIVPAINRFVNANILLQETSIASSRLMDILQIDYEKSKSKKPFEMINNICIEDGQYSWNRRKDLFRDINLLIRKGEITSLCGPSGSGKSTLVQILQRKYELNEGKLLVDGANSSDIDLYDFRKNVAVVPQSIKIFNGTMLDNILVGRELSNLNIVNDRINELGLDQFYKNFEHGLMTLLGEEGIELSGGEKQVLSITRALLDTPEILIIDEGLSGVDVDLENLIFRILKKFSRFHAVVLITHQIYSILQSDYVYVLFNGEISEEGRPGDLMNQEGYLNKYFARKREIYSAASV